MTAADTSPSPGSPANVNTGVGPMRTNLDPMAGALGSNLDPMMGSVGPLGLGGVGTMDGMGRVGTMARMARSSEQRRPGSGEVFPSDLQVFFSSLTKACFESVLELFSYNNVYPADWPEQCLQLLHNAKVGQGGRWGHQGMRGCID